MLPIEPHLQAISSSLNQHKSLILQAEPGAGKTTRVPLALLENTDKKVIVLEPRRLAAKLAATRIAAENGHILGQLVGYRVRHEGQSSEATRLLFVTEGLFFRRLLTDPQLRDIGVVVLDEFHERQIHCDLALAAVKHLQQTVRPDLKLCVMSATLETTVLQAYLPEAEVFQIAGRTFPVALEYVPPVANEDLLSTVKRATLKLHDDPRCRGDILIFLTGMAEIMRAATMIANALPHCDVLPLTAELSQAQQARVFRPSERRKIVLATNVAETSVTIPGVTGVIDCGLAKQAGQATWNGLATLDVKKVSQASCIQRAGRAGRMEPGVAYRLFTEQDFYARPAFTTPEIQRSDLAQTLLEVRLLAERLGDTSTLLPWFEAPDSASIDSAELLLIRLGALRRASPNEPLKLTDVGKRMAELPIHPRLAAMMMAGEKHRIKAATTLAACIISEGYLLSRGFQAAVVGDCDLRYQMELFCQVLERRDIHPRVVADALDRGQVMKVQKLYESLSTEPTHILPAACSTVSTTENDAFAAAVLAGFPDRLAKRRHLKKEHEGLRSKLLFNFCLGRGGQLAPGSVCRDEDLIVALDATEAVTSANAAQGITIWNASGVTVEQLLRLDNDLKAKDDICIWNEEAERVDVVKRQLYGQLTLKEERGSASTHDVEEILRQALLNRWPKPFEDASDLSSYHARLEIITSVQENSDLPRFEGELFELLAAAICEGKRSFKEIAARSLNAYLHEQLSYDQQRQLAELAPANLKLRNGKELQVHYEVGKSPWLAGFIQDFYGVSETPKIAGGRAALSVHLLGPNRRPLQVTADLGGFWRNTYPALRQELSRNYPRHHWAEDPLKAPPILHKKRLP